MSISLKELQALTDSILRELDSSDFSADPINWGDLRCSAARRIEDQDGEIALEVTIEEAAPSSYELRVAVAERLFNITGFLIEVVTEW